MRLFPLEDEVRQPMRGHRTVNPLSHRTNTLGQTMAQTQPPQPPMQQHPMQQRPPQQPPMHQAAGQHAAMQHAPPSSPPAPEQAAAEFARINKGLPDGVQYEPLDEQTLQLLREKGHLPKLPEATPPTTHAEMSHTPGAPAQPAPTASIAVPSTSLPPTVSPAAPVTHSAPPADKIKALMQDSHNAYNFYTQWAQESQAENEAGRTVFAALAQDCAAHVEQYRTVLQRSYGRDFSPAAVDLQVNISFEAALKLAPVEENKMIQALAEVMREVEDAAAQRALQGIFNQKCVGFNRLLLL